MVLVQEAVLHPRIAHRGTFAILPGLRSPDQATPYTFSCCLPSHQPLMIWMRPRLPPMAAQGEDQDLGALPACAAGEVAAHGTPLS